MRILLINAPHTAIGSRIPDEHLPPLGLLAVGGPLIDAGHCVHLIDAELAPLDTSEIERRAIAFSPDVVMFGHSGSTSAHPVIAEIIARMDAALPDAKIVYGGVFPTFHWKEVLTETPGVDVVVRGEGEETSLRLVEALEKEGPLDAVDGIAFRKDGEPHATAPAPVIDNLDAYRVGFELIDHRDYSYWGGKRAVVIQFSRGCPHHCSYCGQRIFWKKWRHRNPKKLAALLARLYREQGVEVVNFADENPTASRKAWKAFLEALIAENVPLTLVASARTDTIVRDADILHLYKQAGVVRFLLGIESYDEMTLMKIKKGAVVSKDKEAISLLRKHGIISMATYVVGFEEETHRDYLKSLIQLLTYDPDQIQIMYLTPHRFTPFFEDNKHRRVIQPDRRRWDFKHQVLATRHMPPWSVLAWVKFIEASMQLRPRALLRKHRHKELDFRAAMAWYYKIGRKVWPYEIKNFFLRDAHVTNGPTLEQFWRFIS